MVSHLSIPECHQASAQAISRLLLMDQMSLNCSRRASACKARIETALPHRVPFTHPGKETLETKTVAAMRGGAISKECQHPTSSVRHKDIELTSSDPYTNSKAPDQFPPSRTQPSAHHNRAFLYSRPQSRRHLASRRPHSRSPQGPQDLSACKMP